MINPGLALIGLLGSGPCITANWPSFTGIGPRKSIFSSPSIVKFFYQLCSIYFITFAVGSHTGKDDRR